MEPVAGQNEALKADPNRTNLRIQGGGSNKAKVPDPYAGHQPLILTYGCVRIANSDVEDLWNELNEDEDKVDSVYVGARKRRPRAG